jgi:3-isopropylmalate dehydrogenase
MDILVLPGDGIGPEITAAARRVLDAVNAAGELGLAFEEAAIGLAALEREGTTLPERVRRRVAEADGVVLGPVSTYDYPSPEAGGVNPSASLRKSLDLYANIRPARSRPGLLPIGRPIDLVIVRENTEGFYADRNMAVGSGEFMPTPDLALAVRKISAEGSRRIARTAFELAAARPRRKVTAVHKANVLKLSDGLFLREVRQAAREHPGIELEEVIVDAMAALLIREPMRFDVVVTTNMFGDILSDEAAEIAGSLGLAGSLNAGAERAVAQAQHGSAPDIAGRDRANPAALILSSAMLLQWLAGRHGRQSLGEAARRIEAAVDAVLADPAKRTRDLGGRVGTAEFGRLVAAEVARPG